MKKILCMTLVLLTVGLCGFAQSTVTVTVGDTTVSSETYSVPFDNFYQYTWTQIIYPASEITAVGMITSIAYQVGSAPSSADTFSTVHIYMGTTSASVNESNSSWLPMEDLTEVYSTTNMPLPTSTGWQVIQLDQPFLYDGSENLVVVIGKTMDEYNSGLKYKYTSVTNSALYRQSDDDMSFSQHPGTGSGFRAAYRSNLKLTINVITGFCYSVTNLAVSSLTATGATINWTGSQNALSYILQYKTAAQSWDSATTVNVYDTTYDMTGLLTASTDYNVRVATDCGDDTSSWKSIAFSTPCGPVGTLPLVENFDAYTGSTATASSTSNLPNCWNHLNAGTNTSYSGYPIIYSSTSYAASGSNSLRFYTYTTSGTYDDQMVILPQIDPSLYPLNTLQLSFDARKNPSYNFTLVVGIITNPMDKTSFVPVDTITGIPNDFTNYEFFFNHYNGPAGFIAIMAPRPASSYNSGYVDNIVVNLIPSCPKPKNLTATGATATSVDLSWTEMGNATMWEIEYGPMGFTQGSGTVATATSNPYTLTGLNPSTMYDFYVRANCGVGDSSDYSSVCTYGTDCAPLNTMPYFENLDLYNGNTSTTTSVSNLPYCWNRINTGSNSSYSGFPYIYASSTYAASGDNSIRFYTYTPSTYSSQVVVLPQIDVTVLPMNTLQLSFDARQNSNHIFTIVAGVMSDPGDMNTFVAVDTIATASDEYHHYEIPLSHVTGTGSYVAIMAPKPATGYNSGYIDNIMLDLLPSCVVPAHVTASNPTATSIDLSWTEMGNATSWDIEYGPMGFTPGSGTTVTVTNIPYTVTGLSHSKGYDFYVRANCGDGNVSSYSNRFRASTACSSISLPYIENFDAYDASSNSAIENLPYCWSRLNTGTSYAGLPVIYRNETYAASGINSLRFYTYTSSAYDDQVAVLPQIDITTNPINTLQLGMDIRDYSTSYPFNLMVGVMTDPTDKTTFTPVDTIITSSTTYAGYTVNFSSYTGSGSYIALMAKKPTSNYNYGQVDNLILETIPTCVRPTDLAATSTITDEVQLSWTDTNASQWNVIYGPTGFDPATAGTLVNGVTTTTYTVTGLTAGVIYDFYVRADCGGGDLSSWTLLPATASPYTYSMGITGTDTVTACDILITDDGGPSGDYSNNCQYTLVLFPGEVDSVVSISGTFVGESTIDYLSVYDGTLVDETNLLQKIVSGTTGTLVTFGPLSSTSGPLTLLFHSDVSVVRDGFAAFVSCVEAPTCPKPFNVQATTVNSTDATITWDDNGMTGFNVAYSIYPNFNPDTCTNVLTTDTNSILLDSLTSFTYYYVAVQSNCGGGNSEWSNIASFLTPCEPLATLPFTENFDNVPGSTSTSVSVTNLPYCWSNINNGTSTSYSGYPMVYASATYAASGTNSMRFYTYTTSGTYDDQIAVLPPFDPVLYPVNTLQVNFDARANSTSYTFVLVVGVLTNPSDKSTFAAIDTLELTSTSYQTFELPLSQYQGTGKYIAFMAPQPTSGYNYGYVDNVVVDLIPSCPKPINLAATMVTDNSIELTWTEVGPATSWEVVYGPAGFTPGDSNSTVAVATSVPFTLSYLAPATTYDIYVRSDCSSEFSQYAPNITVTTACVPVSTLPFEEGFDTYGTGSTVYPDCWGRINTYAYGDRPYVSSAYYAGVGSLYFYASSSSYNVAVTPLFDTVISINTLQASFMYKATNSTDYLIVGVISDPTDIGTFAAVDTIYPSSPASTWVEREVNFSTYTGTGRYIAFYNGNGSSTSYAYLDNLSIDLIPTCPKPSQVSVVSTTVNTATLSWTAGGSETSWEIAYGPVGFDPDGAAATVVTANSNPFTVQNLAAATPYEFYVRATCSATEQSLWSSQPASGVTECSGTVALPYTENFDSYAGTVYNDANGIAPACWTTYSNNATYGAPHITGSGSYHYTHSDPNCMVFTCSSAGSDAYAALPSFAEPLNTLTLNFWRAMESVSYGTLTVGYVTDLNNLAASFVEVDTIPNVGSSAGDTISVDFNGTDIPATGNICFRWFKDGTYYSCCIDDINVTSNYSPADPTVATDAASAITQTGATLNGTITNPDNVAITAKGFEWKTTAGGTYTTVDVTGDVLTYDLTGLTPNTGYTYKAFITFDGQTVYGDEISFTTEIDSTGIENHLQSRVSLYPNPAKEYVDIRVDGDLNVTAMEVYDVYGKLVNTVIVNDNPTRINVSGLADGMYFVRVTTEAGAVTKTFVKK